MWFILVTLLVNEGVHTASIGYPYGSILTYSPQKSSSLHGYLRYLDNYGYNSAQPVYAVRQIKYINSATPTLEAIPINNSEEVTKARETYLRAASLQQYQHLKNDIDALKAEGKEPSPEKLSKLQILERISFSSDFSLIAELPEVKSTLHELEAGISGSYREPVQNSSNQPTYIKQSTGEIKTYVGNTNTPLATIEETPEQKRAREDHLRIYNEQIAHLKHLELEHQKYVQEVKLKSNIRQSSTEDKPIDKIIENSKSLAEFEKAQQEHFRLWNEAKLRAEQANYGNSEKGVQKKADQQQISATNKNYQTNYSPKHTSTNIQNSENQPLTQHFDVQNLKSTESALQLKDQKNYQTKLLNDRIQITEQHQVVDTPEVMRAREEHLRIVNDAILRAQQEQQENIKLKTNEGNSKPSSEPLSQQVSNLQLQNLKDFPSAINYRAEQPVVEETPEVKKAREDHLRLVHEANQRAQFVEQQELKYKHDPQKPILKSHYEQHQQQKSETSKANAEHLRLVNDAQFEAYLKEKNEKVSNFPHQQQISGETAEVQRAREEHLRIFNSIKEHAEQEQAKQSGRIFPHPQSDQRAVLDFEIEQERLLKLENLREAERLQKEKQLLELDLLREAERLAEEKRQMDAELMRLRLEEEKRLEMEQMLEEKRLQQELKEYQNGEYQEIIIQNVSPDQQSQTAIIPIVEEARSQQNIDIGNQQSQQFAGNPFLKANQIVNEPTNRLEHSATQQNSLLKTALPLQTPSDTVVSKSAVTSSDSNIANVRYIQSPHHSSGNKHQYVQDDKVKHNYHDSAGYQPADTAVALIALEKATNDHFRAHELALEQLRIARIQNPSVKDCN